MPTWPLNITLKKYLYPLSLVNNSLSLYSYLRNPNEGKKIILPARVENSRSNAASDVPKLLAMTEIIPSLLPASIIISLNVH